MDRNLILQRIQALLAEVTQRPDLVLTRDTQASDVYGWDSLAHLKLLSAIEAEFDIIFGVDEFEAPEDVGALADLVDRLAASQAG